jgi:hypothetical protein
MERILERKVPSWSWMAYKGDVTYMSIPFYQVEWSNAVTFLDISGNLEVQAPVREFLNCTIELENQTTECSIFAEGAQKRGSLKFDWEDITDTQRL